MDEQRVINRFLKEVFSGILKIEEKTIADSLYPNLSLREIHVLETVLHMEETNENTSAKIAQALYITPGTLTTTVHSLSEKGYLKRTKDSKDKRIVRIIVTEQGKNAQHMHEIFHEDMTSYILEQLTEEEIQVFSRSLQKLAAFFHNKEQSLRPAFRPAAAKNNNGGTT